MSQCPPRHQRALLRGKGKGCPTGLPGPVTRSPARTLVATSPLRLVHKPLALPQRPAPCPQRRRHMGKISLRSLGPLAGPERTAVLLVDVQRVFTGLPLSPPVAAVL